MTPSPITVIEDAEEIRAALARTKADDRSIKIRDKIWRITRHATGFKALSRRPKDAHVKISSSSFEEYKIYEDEVVYTSGNFDSKYLNFPKQYVYRLKTKKYTGVIQYNGINIGHPRVVQWRDERNLGFDNWTLDDYFCFLLHRNSFRG